MIDLHCHALPGIDDGPDTMAGSVALARRASDQGVSKIVATPHVSSRYPNQAGTIRRLVEELNDRLQAEEVAVEVVPGAEIALTRIVDLEPDGLDELGLGGGSWLLIEFPFTAAGGALERIAVDLIERGRHVVIAHPERCAAFHQDRTVLRSLVQAGAVTSLTAGSLIGRFGGEARRVALELVQEGLVHNVASDAHDHIARPPGIVDELAQAGLASLTTWLTESVPAAILADKARIPPRPDVEVAVVAPPKRRRGWLLSGR